MCSNSVWRVHALDIRNGEQLAGWPVSIDAASVDVLGVHQNGHTRRWTATRSGGAGGAGAGALIGAAASGKKGAAVGALVGGGGAAVYTYGIRRRRRGARY